MKTTINREYLQKIDGLAKDFAEERTKLFLSESYDKVFNSAYDVYYSIGVFLYIRLYKRSQNPNDFNFNRIHSGLLKRFSCKLYHKILLDLEKNQIVRVNNHYNWVQQRNGVKQQTFTKSFMLSSDVIRMIHQSQSRLEKDPEIYVPERILKLFPMIEEKKLPDEETVKVDASHRLNRILKEETKTDESVTNFYQELKFDEQSLVEFCDKDNIMEYFYRKDLTHLKEKPRLIKGRWYHIFHSFSKKFREQVLRLEGKKIKEIFDISASDLHMLAKILEKNDDIPVPELRKFQIDVMNDFRKKFGVKKDGKCKAGVKRAFKIYLNSKESFYYAIRGNSICKKIDDYFRERYPNIREYIVHKEEIWLDVMNAEFEYMSDKLVNELHSKHNAKSLTCHDSIWVEEDADVPDIRKMFYDTLDLMAYREQKLEDI